MSAPVPPRPIRILVVDDNPDDLRLFELAARKLQRPHEISTVHDGVEAMDFLRGRGKYGGRPRPDIVFLDFSMPRKGGREVLAEVRADLGLKDLPVVVTTINEDPDIVRSWDASAFVVKPVQESHLARLLDRFVPAR